MTSLTQVPTHPYFYGEPWPPDDTEESVVGTDLQQTSILNLRLGINEAAQLYRSPGQPVPWKALDQTLLLGCERPDGSAYRTMPDVFVYPKPIDPNRGSVSINIDGPPILIIEVLSESTYESDLNIERGKGYSYARAGVREYLALDPTCTWQPEGGKAWRLVNEVYQPWERNTQGRWQSDLIPVDFGLEGVLATVYTRAGRRLLREGEVEIELDRRDAEMEELRRRLRELTREKDL